MVKWLSNKIPSDKFTIVTFHHHLLPIPQTGRERNILLDSGDTLKLLVGHKVNLVLNGHKHVSNSWKVENMVILNSVPQQPLDYTVIIIRLIIKY